jgi:hypothetical protein
MLLIGEKILLQMALYEEVYDDRPKKKKKEKKKKKAKKVNLLYIDEIVCHTHSAMH